MKDVSELMKDPGTDSEIGGTLERVFLSADAQHLMLFHRKYEEVRLHYEGDESISSYFHCIGHECPYCELKKTISEMLLFPVLDVATETVKILSVPSAKGPGKLLTALLPLLRRQDLNSVILCITRKKYTFFVETIEGQEATHDALAVVEQFSRQLSDGSVNILNAYPKYSIEELQEVPGIKRVLAMREPTRGAKKETSL